MKTLKKVTSGLGILIALLAFFGYVHQVKVLAAVTFDQAFWQKANYTWVNGAINVSDGASSVTFSSPAENTGKFYAGGTQSSKPPGFCATPNVITVKVSDIGKDGASGSLSVLFPQTFADSNGRTTTQCQGYTQSINSIKNPTAGGKCNYLACSKDDIKSLASSKFTLTDVGTITTTFKSKPLTFTDGIPSDNDHTFQASSGLFCSGGGFDHHGAITISDDVYQKISKSNSTVDGSLDVDWYNASNKSCNNYGTGKNNLSPVKVDLGLLTNLEGRPCGTPGEAQGNLICGGTDNTACTSQGCVWALPTTPTPAPPGSDNSCEGSGNTGFEWIFCGVLRIFDKIANTFNSLIEQLLDFNVSTYLTTQVHAAWSVFKNLASALLVIILLIMVIAQAVGGGPLDAYTVRKILPRIVAAVILMQISWYMLIWAIELANTLGHGIRDLITAPFGGVSNLNLDKLVGQLGTAAAPVSETALFTTIIVGTIFSGLTIGGIALLGLSVVLSEFVGLIVLLLRELLIILCVILFPLAILAWILPGTQRYWKLWSDNFIKLLMLFPLIMGVIYGGRIFAHIAGTPGASPLTHILALFIVFVGYFGPYWFLPKTFKWGGQAFAAMSSGALDATKNMRDFPRKYAMGAAKENRERRGELRAARLADNPNNRRFTDRLLAGEFNFAKARGRGGQLGAREMQFAKTLAQGEKESRESVPAQLLRSGYDSWRHGPTLDERGERILEGQPGYEINKLDANQAWLEGRTYAGITPDAALRGHAFDTLVQLGDPDRIRMARQNSEIPEEIWSKAVARNFPKLNEIARYLTLSPDLSNLAVRQFSTQDDDTAQELVRQLEGDYIYNRETGGRIAQTPAQHREALQRAADLAADARNPLIWVDLGQTKKQVISQIEAMAAAEGIEGVSADARRRGTPTGPAPTPTPTPPPPPVGPGPEDDETEIHLDHDPEI